MRTIRSSALALGLLYLCFFALLAWSNARLPTVVATHFGMSGQANGWMSRSGYLWFMIVFGLAFPLFVPAICYASRFLPGWCFNIPHRDYWLAPERRRGLSEYLFGHSLWFACMALGFVLGIHYSTLQANSVRPAHLSNLLVFSLAGGFVVGTAIWAGSMLRHLNRVA